MRFLIHPPSSDPFGMTGNFFVVKGRSGNSPEILIFLTIVLRIAASSLPMPAIPCHSEAKPRNLLIQQP